MRKGTINILSITHFNSIGVFIVLMIITAACHKETNTSKLSSTSCFLNYRSSRTNGYFICEGKPGFYAANSIYIDTIYYYETQSELSRVDINVLNGNFSQSLLGYNPPLPKFVTRVNYLNQLKPNINSFIMFSEYEQWDSTFKKGIAYKQLYLTDKNISSPKKFKLLDSAVEINTVKQMDDGRFVISTTKGTSKSLSCYNSNLKFDWTRSVNFGNNTNDYENKDVLVTNNSIYLLQVAKYLTKNYTILQYNYDGIKKNTYDLPSTTNKFTAGQLIESANGFYIIGTKYLPEQSDYDISISAMSPSNKLLSEHGLNIASYLPDWNTTKRNLSNTYFSGSTSFAIKTANGYAYAFTYPNEKDQYNLALVMLNNDMNIESVKVISRNIGYSFDIQYANEILSLFSDGNQLYIILKHYDNNYFFVLDKNGDQIK